MKSLQRSMWAACLIAGAASAQSAVSTAEAEGLAAIRAQATQGVIAVQPWAQLMGSGRLGIGWITSLPADGVVEWTQTFDAGQPFAWQEAWFSEDGLRQANGTAQRAVIEGYDPSRPLRFRARSRAISSFKPYKVAFDEPARSQERILPALARPDGAVSFIVFNDIHNRAGLYQPLLNRAGAPIDFAVLNGDVLQDPQSEAEIVQNLLQPMSWFTARGIPCFFLRGNHETRGAAARRLKDYLTLPDGRYYTAMTFGAARVVLLDCGEDKPDTSPEYSGLVDFDRYMEAQLAWFAREIETPAFRQAMWRLVVVHIPPDWRVPEEKLWHGARRMRERFAPLFDKGRVHAVISGHNHKAELVEPCPDAARGFRWPVFIGGAHPLEKATVIRVDADARRLAIRCIRSDGTVHAEQQWRR